MKIHNFSAGPSILPQEVLQESSKAVLDFNQSGLSILEISHRSKDFIAVMDKAVALVRELLSVPEDYEVLFLQGGASLQFVMIPFNLMKIGGKAGYLDTGEWSSKALKEAKKFGEVVVLASSEDKNHTYIPKDYVIPADLDYIHLTSNNTIFGTQIQSFSKQAVPVVCDMSSDIFSRKINVADFDLIYAGAQKNMGPAGATLVIVKKDILGKTGRDIPSYLDYQVHAKAESMFNTPPVYATYVSMLTLQWLKDKGGVEAIEKINNEKADLLYKELERNALFKTVAQVEDRSKMNVTFLLADENLTETFDAFWKSKGISAISGHRKVGGYRASIYNALSKESVLYLIEVLQEFEKQNS
ncbi:MAG: 3-phosphoserine/phosphohydroxythreonine transaminase [Flavobacteriaceae bacterium]|nr:MAG: 3-phosphoserine/phosphohydroxythreonine transaminase [Flavobacteriaceae bacterium]